MPEKKSKAYSQSSTNTTPSSTAESKFVSKQKKGLEVTTNEAKRRINHQTSQQNAPSIQAKNLRNRPVEKAPKVSSEKSRRDKRKEGITEAEEKTKSRSDIPEKKDSRTKCNADSANRQAPGDSTYTPVEMPLRADWLDLPKEKAI